MDYTLVCRLGLEKIYWLTSRPNRKYKLRVDLVDSAGNSSYAEYDNFAVSDEANNYYITYRGFTDGGAGDGFRTYHMNRPFSAMDADNDHDLSRNCAQIGFGGWWYGECGYSNLNKGNVYWDQTSVYVSSTMRIMSC